MGYYKAVFDLDRKIEEKAPEERDIHGRMSIDPLFADPPVPYADFLLAINEQTKAVDNAQYGGIERIATMRSQEKVVDDMVRQLRTFVTLKADGDTGIILSSGFRHTKPRTTAGDMPKVQSVKKMYTELSGALKLKWKPVANAGFYEVQVRTVVPVKPLVEEKEGQPEPIEVTEEGAWVPVSIKPSNIEIKGLKPLTYYEVRVRANGAKGFGPFSDVVVLLVT
jgi:hypothetical protein